jgi:adenine specific DNA methylase Mod
MPTLDWIGKKAVVNHDREVPFHLLKCDPDLSVGESESANLLVQGDNLLALKALLPYYARQVKCIYIDPPYNTGEENWIYNDNVNSPEIKEWLGRIVGKKGEDLSRHDKWLCMMYPRVKLLLKFLKDEGVIFVSIDDNSVALLRMLLDELIGRDKFVAMITWQKRYSRENRAIIGDVHEYIVVYALNPQKFKSVRNKTSPTENQKKIYRNPNNDPKGPWRTIPLTAQAGHATPEQFYEITSPSGKVFKPPKGRCWGIAKATFEKYLEEGRIYFGKNNDSQPNLIRHFSEVEGVVPWTWWPHEEVGHTDEAKKEILTISGKLDLFDTPKPERLMKRIIEIATNKGELVLDSFAGSGTTAAVAHKMERRWIIVEMETNCIPLITKRLSNIVEGKNEMGVTKDVNWKGGGGYKFCTLGETLFENTGQIAKSVSFIDLARFVFFKESGLPLPDDVSGKTPLIGTHNGAAIYLLYNGVLVDKTPQGGNALTRSVLAYLPSHDGPKVVYGTSCRVGMARLKQENIIFRQIPYELKVD